MTPRKGGATWNDYSLKKTSTTSLRDKGKSKPKSYESKFVKLEQGNIAILERLAAIMTPSGKDKGTQVSKMPKIAPNKGVTCHPPKNRAHMKKLEHAMLQGDNKCITPKQASPVMLAKSKKNLSLNNLNKNRKLPQILQRTPTRSQNFNRLQRSKSQPVDIEVIEKGNVAMLERLAAVMVPSKCSRKTKRLNTTASEPQMPKTLPNKCLPKPLRLWRPASSVEAMRKAELSKKKIKDCTAENINVLELDKLVRLKPSLPQTLSWNDIKMNSIRRISSGHSQEVVLQRPVSRSEIQLEIQRSGGLDLEAIERANVAMLEKLAKIVVNHRGRSFLPEIKI
ncbi:uncharacterized protein LOC103191006 [Callorhinchus milii]|uniref:uncharacterized protein LOC103191006 n=1 Tax=Callorhinchus milii TaxID=7868 RepID=UPI000457471B|nr:uncharacterized protein LOC103191006 [Callorhinchus milii]|eukprot:gi/632986239/ref/XP_007910125.1/ PREDICTED: uncharacterized protein LOC103191006 [Callorhinchus milii]